MYKEYTDIIINPRPFAFATKYFGNEKSSEYM